MDYQNYDDYMRSVLGQSNMNCSNMGCMDCSNMNYSNMYMNNPAQYQNMFQSCDYLETMYPDTYRVVYPMVVSACNMVNSPVTEDMLDRMTNDIYDRAETDGRINIDINVGVEVRENNDSKQVSSDSRQMRPRRNRFFRDLIRILLIRELLRRRRRPGFPNRPF